jgi:hypothetical protein
MSKKKTSGQSRKSKIAAGKPYLVLFLDPDDNLSVVGAYSDPGEIAAAVNKILSPYLGYDVDNDEDSKPRPFAFTGEDMRTQASTLSFCRTKILCLFDKKTEEEIGGAEVRVIEVPGGFSAEEVEAGRWIAFFQDEYDNWWDVSSYKDGASIASMASGYLDGSHDSDGNANICKAEDLEAIGCADENEYQLFMHWDDDGNDCFLRGVRL